MKLSEPPEKSGITTIQDAVRLVVIVQTHAVEELAGENAICFIESVLSTKTQFEAFRDLLVKLVHLLM